MKSNFRSLTAAFTLGALCIGFTPAAMAVSTYNAEAGFELTLTDVQNSFGAQETTGWDVNASGSVDTLSTNTTGPAANASGFASVVDPAVSMNIADAITQTSTSNGTATNGSATTDVYTDLNITVTNNSGKALTFFFDFNVTAIAEVTGDNAIADASVDILDDYGYVDILAIASAGTQFGPSSDDDSMNGTFEFMLSAGETNNISGLIDSYGDAVSTVPIPAAAWLFGSGLLGLIGIARRKKA